MQHFGRGAHPLQIFERGGICFGGGVHGFGRDVQDFWRGRMISQNNCRRVRFLTALQYLGLLRLVPIGSADFEIFALFGSQVEAQIGANRAFFSSQVEAQMHE